MMQFSSSIPAVSQDECEMVLCDDIAFHIAIFIPTEALLLCMLSHLTVRNMTYIRYICKDALVAQYSITLGHPFC